MAFKREIRSESEITDTEGEVSYGRVVLWTIAGIGIVIGVASVTTVIAALTGLKENVLNEFASFGAANIFVRPDWSRATIGRRIDPDMGLRN